MIHCFNFLSHFLLSLAFFSEGLNLLIKSFNQFQILSVFYSVWKSNTHILKVLFLPIPKNSTKIRRQKWIIVEFVRKSHEHNNNNQTAHSNMEHECIVSYTFAIKRRGVNFVERSAHCAVNIRISIEWYMWHSLIHSSVCRACFFRILLFGLSQQLLALPVWNVIRCSISTIHCIRSPFVFSSGMNVRTHSKFNHKFSASATTFQFSAHKKSLLGVCLCAG